MRDEKIDILRFIGLAMVILSHVRPQPSIILQLRNFDVPLLVWVSAASFGLSYKDEPYKSYIWKRTKRLLFPTWIFLTTYFLLMLATGYPTVLPDMKTITTSYLLLTGIGFGYVWIIRVFLLVAIVAPAIFQFSHNTRSHTRYFSILGAIYVDYEIVLHASRPLLSSPEEGIFESTVLFIVPYAIVFAVGLRLPELTRNQILRLTVGSFVIFGTLGTALFALSGKFIPTQAFKYPPSIYYLSYALAVSSVIWLASDTILNRLKSIKISTPALFVGQNSMWIFLWHIPLIEMIHLPFYFKYPLIFVLASLATFIQVRFVRWMLVSKIGNPSIRKNLRLLFTG